MGIIPLYLLCLLKPPLSIILNPPVRFGSSLLNAALLLLLSLPFQPHQAAVWDKKYKLGAAYGSYGSAQHRISEEQTGTWASVTIRMTFIRWYTVGMTRRKGKTKQRDRCSPNNHRRYALFPIPASLFRPTWPNIHCAVCSRASLILCVTSCHGSLRAVRASKLHLRKDSCEGVVICVLFI